MALEYLLKGMVPYVVHTIEIMGIFIISIAALKAFFQYFTNIKKPNKNQIKIKFAESVALALEFKLSSEIIKTVIIRSQKELIVLGAVILLRVILTFVTQWEIKNGSKENGQQNQQQA